MNLHRMQGVSNKSVSSACRCDCAYFYVVPACTGFVHDLDTARYSLQSLQDPTNELTSHARPLTSLRARSVGATVCRLLC
jgi:hypothetical protein